MTVEKRKAETAAKTESDSNVSNTLIATLSDQHGRQYQIGIFSESENLPRVKVTSSGFDFQTKAAKTEKGKVKTRKDRRLRYTKCDRDPSQTFYSHTVCHSTDIGAQIKTQILAQSTQPV